MPSRRRHDGLGIYIWNKSTTTQRQKRCTGPSPANYQWPTLILAIALFCELFWTRRRALVLLHVRDEALSSDDINAISCVTHKLCFICDVAEHSPIVAEPAEYARIVWVISIVPFYKQLTSKVIHIVHSFRNKSLQFVSGFMVAMEL